MKTKKSKKKIQIEFNEEHLPVLINALETYSRLQSGQIGIAMDTVYADRNLTYEERQHIEKIIRYHAFPRNAKREYDGHGGFYDLYDNEYNDKGEIVKESEDWKNKKNRPHLDHPNSSFGVGCEEMMQGTIAWEIKKVIDQYVHYKRNKGYRRICDVSGDGMPHSYSKVPPPVIVDFKPQKEFVIPKKFQQRIEKQYTEKNFVKIWNLVDTAFTKKPLPKGSKSQVIKNNKGDWVVVVHEPYII